MTTPMIAFKHVNKQYADAAPAVNDLSLTIGQNELFVLVGTSGSGKTTTLKMINELIQPTSGTIDFAGKPLSDYNVRDLRWNIGYVLQQIALFPNMTVGQNIALIPELKHWDKAKIAATVDDLLEQVELPPDKYRDRMPSELSGGEQQRVGILRALATQPEVILMDEPFSALDPISRTQLQDLLLRMHKKFKTTIVFVTHDMNEALKLGDRIAIMRYGRLLQVDTPAAIAEHPVNDFVESFFATSKSQNALLDEPVGALENYWQPAHPDENQSETGVDTETLVREVLPQLADTDHIAIKRAGALVGHLTRQDVIRYLSDQTHHAK
ncbi:ABC transporter ATP-binding protein [Lactobacillus selangorensis]|uniref:ABC-type quaternary amine transporter n=1 Tax=Lactobacillus selangorensis TaxID=81857 RepID=A0A0R2FH69_9LACO|nr:ABC transporter ATP-binding protein [Lactobacillus selangorensis]KRN27939.1 ABC transporter ATP-binding protein [Lactobacillus selangorensis]KRN30590.1 ABC transporter ATP-binding protein [Lactobacillus selangorensis]